MTDIHIDNKILLSDGTKNFEPYITTDSTLNTESTNPIQNGIVTTELNGCLRYDVQGTSQGGAAITTNHSSLRELDYESSGHTGFMSSANFLPSGTVINVELDGTGQFTNLDDAIIYLNGKYSNGQVTIKLGDGTFVVTHGFILSGNNFNIPNLILQGNGVDSTIISYQYTTSAICIFAVERSNLQVLHLTITNPEGTINTDYRGIIARHSGFADVSHCKFVGLNYAISAFIGGEAIFGDCYFAHCKWPIVAEAGRVSAYWATSATFENTYYGLYVNGGGSITGAYNTFTYNNVQHISNQAFGSATAQGWIGITGSV